MEGLRRVVGCQQDALSLEQAKIGQNRKDNKVVGMIERGSYDHRVIGALASHDGTIQGVQQYRENSISLVWVGVHGAMALDPLPCSNDDQIGGAMAQLDVNFSPIDK